MTINEIAKLAGVSRATVSRYLNKGYVSDDKKEKIKKVIEDTGYIPSSYAQTLRSKQSRTIGVIIPKLNSDSISRMVDGISSRLKEDDYHLLLTCTHNDEKEELRSLNLFKENQVDGIILLGTIFTSAHRKICDHLAVPLVILGQNIPGYSCIYSDEYHSAYALGKEIAATSKKVGLITVTDKDLAVGVQRRNGFTDALESEGIEIKKTCIVKSKFTMQDGYNACEKLISKQPKLDTLICATDTIAGGALQYLHQAGYSVPKDIQITGFGDSTLSKVTSPTLSTVHFFYEDAGKKAADMLLDRISHKSSGAENVASLCLNYKVLLRESTR